MHLHVHASNCGCDGYDVRYAIQVCYEYVNMLFWSCHAYFSALIWYLHVFALDVI